MAATKPIIKVAAICGSLRKASINGGLLRSAIELSESIDGMTIEYVDISPLPLLNTDLEVDGKYPPAVEAFRQKIHQSDCFLFASPEYNYSVTAPLKNAIDWASRAPNVWANKTAAIVSAGGDFGGGRSQYHLRQTAVFIDLHIINKPEFVLNAFQPPEKFDGDGNLIDPKSKERLKAVLLSLKDFTLRLQKDKGINHPHNLTPQLPIAEPDAQNTEAHQKLDKIRKMHDLLVHASQCHSPQCRYLNCGKVKELFRHGSQCKVRASGGCARCKKIWNQLQIHARLCKESQCYVPRCRDVKELLKEPQRQSEEPGQDGGINHPHKLTPHLTTAERDAQNTEAHQKHDWVSVVNCDIRKMHDLLVHASQCRSSQCQYLKCSRMKNIFRHLRQCKVCVSGGCVRCKAMWKFLKYHACSCKESRCYVSRCRELK